MQFIIRSFTAHKQNHKINLNWITLSEINNDYFILQKSKDCMEFYDIDYVLRNGTTSYINHYSSIDYNPYIGDNYYRLKQVDFDGTTEYSKIIHVDFEENQLNTPQIEVFPVPFSNTINIANASREQIDRINIYDLSGKSVFSRDIKNSDFMFSFNLSFLSKGSYVLKISFRNNTSKSVNISKF